MRTVKSLSSLTSLAATAVVVPWNGSSGTVSAFVSPSLTLSPQDDHNFSHSSLLSPLAAVAGADIPIPPSVDPPETMSSSLSSSTAAAAFLSTSSQPPSLIADPTMLLGHSQAQPTEVKSPAFFRQEVREEDANAAVVANNPLLVPPSKSLRHKLKLPTTTTTTMQPAAASTTSSQPRPRIVGHRGALYEELENTRPAFLACAGICDAVELDVFLLKDGNLVVFHGSGTDKNPGFLNDYCTNANDVQKGATSILDLTLEEAQRLRFNADYAELAAPAAKVKQGRIPTLEQVLLDLQPTGMEVKIELKGPGTARPVVDLVDRLDMVHQVSYSSFNLQEIDTVRKLKPQRESDGSYVYPRGALFDEVPANYLDQARAVGASEVHLRYDTCTVDRIRDIHAAGLGSMVWMRGPVGMKADVEQKFWDIGNEDESCFATLIETGVQQLCVNRPKVLYDLLQRQTQQQPQFAPSYSVAQVTEMLSTIPPTPSMITAQS